MRELREQLAALTRSKGQTIDNDSRILVPVSIVELEAIIEASTTKARLDAYSDCGSKGGTGTAVRAYAKSRANGLTAPHKNNTDVRAKYSSQSRGVALDKPSVPPEANNGKGKSST